MLACDLVLAVRASRTLSGEQVTRLAHELGSGPVDPHDVEILVLIDRYAERADPSWKALYARATANVALPKAA